METLGDHLEAAIAWTLAGLFFGTWIFIRLGGLSNNSENLRIVLESRDSLHEVDSVTAGQD